MHLLCDNKKNMQKYAHSSNPMLSVADLLGCSEINISPLVQVDFLVLSFHCAHLEDHHSVDCKPPPLLAQALQEAAYPPP